MKEATFLLFLVGLLAAVDSLSVPTTPTSPFRVVAPRNIIPGETFAVYVHSEDVNTDGQRMTVSLHHSSGRSLADSRERLVRPDSFNRFVLEPPVDAAVGEYHIAVYKINDQNRTKIKNVTVTVQGKSRIILIQTDKPIYKPGETVMGRAIVLDRQTKSATGAVTVTIQNPKSNTMGRFDNINLDYGVGNFEFPLSSEPVLGTHRVCATYEGLPKGQSSCFSFEVERYVLPKFSCSITPTDEVLSCSQKAVCFSVSATYTYGQKVKGFLRAIVSHGSRWSRCPNSEVVLIKMDGTTKVCATLKDCSRWRYCDGDAMIDVNVTDSATQTTVQCDGTTSVPIKRIPYKLTITEQDNSFHPCQVTTVKVAASTSSGIPKIANISLDGWLYTKNKNSCREHNSLRVGPLYQLTDRRGLTTFSVCMPCSALSISFTVSAVPETSGEASKFSNAYSYRNFIYSPETITLSSNEQEVQIGETVNVTASFSSAVTADYYVVSSGQIVDHNRCGPKSDKKARNKHKQLCKTGNMKYTCYISLLVTSSMAPKFTVIVSQKTLATSRIAFDVIRNTKSRISLQFGKGEVRPGDKVDLVITAPSMSYVGVVAVDQSVYIQQDKNQLTNSKLYEEVGRFDKHKELRSQSYQCGWYVYWDCPCQCYGKLPTSTPPTKGELKTDLPTPTSGIDEEPSRAKGDEKRIIDDVIALPFLPPLPRPRSKGKCCPRNCTRVYYQKQYCSYIQASSFFTASGVQVSDSETAPPENCPKPTPPPKPEETFDCCWPEPIPLFFRNAAENLEQLVAVKKKTSTSTSNDLVSPTRVRQHFPETWLWFHRKTRNDSLQETVTVPDTITSWVTDAFAVSSSTPMSIASPETLRVFKPFFIDINLPYSVVRGELVEIIFTVYNYLETTLTVYVDVVVDANDVRIVQGKKNKNALNQQTRTVEVAAGDGQSLFYFVLPLRNGHLPIQATARSTAAADSLIRTLLVEPEGVKQEYAQSSLLCHDDEDDTPASETPPANKPIVVTFNVTLPSDFVPDSESAVASVTANYMGPTIDGLDNLLRLPTGCGEQNMLNFAPAVYIARYLETVGQLDDATRKKALHFMQTGYQREMTYQREDGSYSAFGNSDRCGSMWLTAFVVRSFAQADGLIGMSIDERVQNDAITFMKSNQNSDGSFPSICSPIHKEMQGCSGGNCSLTAYVTLALLEAGESPKDRSVKMALDYLTNRCIAANCSSPYNLALIAFTLSRAVIYDIETEEAIEALKSCAVIDVDHTYWQYSLEQSSHSVRSWFPYERTRSCDIETTAYALLAFTNKDGIPYSLPIVRWLIKQRNPRGGFKSTQDTVVALQALSEYAKLTVSDGRVATDVSLSADQLTQTLRIDSSNAMQVQKIQLPHLPTVLHVTASGTGCILASVGVVYNVPKPDKVAAFEVSATAALQKGTCKYVVTVCNKWLRNEPDSSNMALTEITFFSGFLPIQSELKQLMKSNRCNVKRTDFKGRALSIYFDEITQTECCFDVTMKRASVVEDLQGVPVLTYNYYEPDDKGGTMLYPREECP